MNLIKAPSLVKSSWPPWGGRGVGVVYVGVGKGVGEQGLVGLESGVKLMAMEQWGLWGFNGSERWLRGLGEGESSEQGLCNAAGGVNSFLPAARSWRPKC